MRFRRRWAKPSAVEKKMPTLLYLAGWTIYALIGVFVAHVLEQKDLNTRMIIGVIWPAWVAIALICELAEAAGKLGDKVRARINKS